MKGVSAKVFLSFEKDYQNGQLAQQTFFLLLLLSIYFPTLTWEMKSGVRSIPFFHMFKNRNFKFLRPSASHKGRHNSVDPSLKLLDDANQESTLDLFKVNKLDAPVGCLGASISFPRLIFQVEGTYQKPCPLVVVTGDIKVAKVGKAI